MLPKLLMIAAATVLLATPASAHVERPSFWPNPASDTAVSPAAGGAVPAARSLSSALVSDPDEGTTRVVCRQDSLQRARDSIAAAQENGYVLRPSQPRATLSEASADKLVQINQQLFARCAYDEIQAAVTASGNNDRVVIMPGLYTEESSRATPSPDPACTKYRNDVSTGGAVSYRFHFYCPNDANLVAVTGRALGPQADANGPGGTPPATDDRHGIPNAGACIRCNLQIEGSGAKPEDVVLEAGDAAAGNGGPSGAGAVKHVGIYADRADGIVIRNLSVRHAREHDIYVMETDGYLIDRTKVLYAGHYGVLTFGVDHGRMQDCVGNGHGDAALYPGGSVDTGTQRDTSWYPTFRYNQEITRCDMHHSNLGYSGTMGNAIHVVDNDIYDNATGLATESFYAGGHPGYPTDSFAYENNRIYSNNFNTYEAASDVKKTVSVPVGTGVLIGGANDAFVRHNLIYDNWRRGVMFFSVPTQFGCPIEGNDCTPKPSPANQLSNSFGNRFYANRLGVALDGTNKPNGVDFWWDQFPATTGNCFYDNGAYTSDPAPSPVAGQSLPGFLPENCATSVGTGDPDKEAELLACAGVTDPDSCMWSQTPPKPGTAAATAFRERTERLAVAAAARSRLAFDAHCLDGGLVQTGLVELSCPGARAALADAFAGAGGASATLRLQGQSCAEWKVAGEATRGQILRSLAEAATEPDPENHGPTLPDGTAATLLDRSCVQPGTAAFLLYVIYNRAAALRA